MKTTILTDKKKTEITSGHETVELSLDSSGLIHLMAVLTNLYSNPRVAVLREYVSNAIDSHVRSGVVDKRIQVSVPVLPESNTWRTMETKFTKLEELTVRDFGAGMNKEDIVEVYSRYGSSTKRDNNNEHGGFGLGAKSALAITSRFDVVSIKDGIKIVFYIEKNGVGAGVIHFVSEEKTDEPSGVEVRIPYTAAMKTSELKAFFVGIDAHLLEVNEEIVDFSVHNEEKFKPIYGLDLDTPVGWVSQKDVRHDTMRSDATYATIGGVLYRIESKSFDVDPRILYYGKIVVLNVPIGAAELTPSRENLVYSERTKKVLSEVSTALLEGIEQDAFDSLNALNTRYEALELVQEYVDANYWKANKLTWRNEQVPISIDLTSFGHRLYKSSGHIPKNELVRIEQLSELSRRGKKDTAVVLSGGNHYDTTEDVAKSIRRNFKAIHEGLGIKDVYVIGSEKDLDNIWVKSILKKEYRTSDDLIEAGKAYSAEQRKLAKAQNVKTGTTPKKLKKPADKIAHFDYKGDRTDVTYVVEQLFTGDPRLNNTGKVFYVKQDESPRVHPGMLSLNEKRTTHLVTVDVSGFWSIAKKALPKKSTVFVLGSQRSLDKFMELYPDAIPLEPYVVAYAKKNVNTNHEINLAKIAADVRISNYTYGPHHNLGIAYQAIEHAGLIEEVTNKEFLRIASQLTPDCIGSDKYAKSTEQLNMERWAEYSEKNNEDYQRAQNIEWEKMERLRKSLFFFANHRDASLGKKMSDAEYLEYVYRVKEYVRYINGASY